MKKSIYWVILLALVLAFSSTAKAVDEIEVALLYPLSGALTEAGKRMKAVYEVAADVINDSYDIQGIPYAKTEGIPSKGGAKIVLKFYDTQGSPEVGKAETERILQDGTAKLIIGAYQSAVSKPTSFVAERNKFPYLCDVSSSAALTERGLKYFFRVAPTDFHDSRMFFKFLDDMAKQGKQVKRVGMVYERTHQRSIPKLGGLAHRIPLYATMLTFFSLASLGLPGLAGFVGEFLILLGAFKYGPIYAICGAVGIVLGAAYLLWMLQRVIFGSLPEEYKALNDLTLTEIVCLMPLVILVIWIGVYPAPFLEIIDSGIVGALLNLG